MPRAGARSIRPEQRVIVIEGNYLLLDRPPWSQLAPWFDRTLFLAVDRDELRRRLIGRWLAHGLDPAAASPEVARKKLIEVLESGLVMDAEYDLASEWLPRP